MKLRTLAAILLTAALCSCGKQPRLIDFTRKPVMELGDNVLYYDEIEDNMPKELSSADSLSFVESYKKKWATDILIYEKAYDNVGNSPKIEKLVNNYKKDLIINEYLTRLATQKVKPMSEDSLYTFYQKNRDNFPLHEAVVKGIFIKVLTTAPDQQKLSKWLANVTDENVDNIMLYCTKNATFQQLFIYNWVPFSDIAPLMAKNIESTDPALSRGTIIQQSEDYTYYLKLTGLVKAGNPAPFEYVVNDIRHSMETREKIDYINKFHEEIYNKAIEKGTIKLYEE